jgi:hypothetical protein
MAQNTLQNTKHFLEKKIPRYYRNILRKHVLTFSVKGLTY